VKIQENIPLAQFTTLKIGGPARYFAKAENEADVIEALAFADERGLPVFILGGGSNVLISDGGFDGLVLRIGLLGIARTAAGGGQTFVTAYAGEDWDAFVAYCVEHDLAGVECLSGIPGRVGGTPVQNVGAYGQEVSETIISVRCFDRRIGRVVELSNPECGFAYRKSIFNSTARGRFIVLSVTFWMVPGGRPKLAYKEVIEYFSGREPSLGDVREAVLAIRRKKSMVIDPTDPNSRSAGSFFKNPVVEGTKFAEIKAAFPAVPSFPAAGGKVKIPAAWLIENAGFHKGFALGNVGISSNHTLALINRGGATAEELIRLKELVQRAAADRFGIDLEPEPIFVGICEPASQNAV
jgi:UDP-N-acetylmuramate dehydrogenase